MILLGFVASLSKHLARSFADVQDDADAFPVGCVSATVLCNCPGDFRPGQLSAAIMTPSG